MTQSNCNSHPIHPVSYCCVRHDIICPLSPGGWSKFFVPMNVFKPLWNAKRQILVSLLYKWSTEKLNTLLKTTQVVFVRARDKPVRHLRACAFKSQSFPVSYSRTMPSFLGPHTWLYSKGLVSCKERRSQLWPRRCGGILGKVRPDFSHTSKSSCLWVRMLTETPDWNRDRGTGHHG